MALGIRWGRIRNAHDSPLDALLEQLEKDPSDYRRGSAAASLGLAEERSAVESLLKALSDPSPWVRGWAAFALGRIRDMLRSAESLCRALDDQALWVREQAAEALERFDADVVYDALRRTMKAAGQVGRVWAIHVMERLRPGSALEIFPYLEDDDGPVRLAAVRALYWLKEPVGVAPLRGLLADSDEQVRAAAAFGLGWIGDLGSVSRLSHALADASGWVRRNAAWSLLRLKAEFQSVASMADDEDAGVRILADKAQALLLPEQKG